MADAGEEDVRVGFSDEVDYRVFFLFSWVGFAAGIWAGLEGLGCFWLMMGVWKSMVRIVCRVVFDGYQWLALSASGLKLWWWLEIIRNGSYPCGRFYSRQRV